MNKKVITAALTGVLTTGMVAPAMANTTKDAATIYRNAYDATMKAKDFKSEDVNDVQTVILEARSAIKELKVLATEKDNKEWLGNVNDWSTIVDGVQQPILSKIIKVVEPMNKKLEAGEAVSQEEINAAVALIPIDLPLVWKNDYTSITDKAQTKLVDEAFAALKKAEAEKTAVLVKEAQAKIDVIKKSTKTAITKQAEVFQGRLDAIKLYDLNVTKVTKITKTNISIEFEALKEAIKDVTIEVKDEAGKIYEVKAQRVIDTDVKEATFKFATELKEDPTGEWTVNGVKYDAQRDRTVDAVKNATTQKELLAALNTKYFENVKEDLIVKYQEALNAINAKKDTVEEIQKIIDDVNKGLDKESFVPAIVEAVTANNEIKLQAALEKAPLERVNSEWISDYMNELKGKNTFNEIQDGINTINKDKVDNVVKEAMKTFDNKLTTKAETLVENYTIQDTEDQKEEVKETLEALELRDALTDVVTSETKSELKAGLTRVAKLDKTFAEVKVNDYLMSDYLAKVEEMKTENVDNKAVITKITEVLSNVQEEKIESAIEAVKDTAGKFNDDSAETKTNFKNALNVLHNTVNDVKVFDIANIQDDKLENYAGKITTDASSISTAEEINNVIIGINNSSTIESVVKSIKEAKTVSVVETGLKQYRDLSKNPTLINAGSLGIKDIAQEMFNKTSTIETEDALKTAITNGETAVKNNLDEINKTGEQSNTYVMETLAKIGIEINADQAEAFNTNRPKHKDTNGDVVNTAFKNYSEIRAVKLTK